jgi:beta-lactamase regulating signal transducer with metallopeptidase domain
VEGLLVNWLWQGCAVALVTTGLLRASRRMSATTRYHLWWVTLAVVLLLPALSFPVPADRFQQEAFDVQLTGSAAASLAGSWKPEAGRVVLPALPAWTGALLVFVWCAWAAVSLARTAAALVTLRRAKRSVRPFPEAREARLKSWLSLRARGRRAELALSDHVRAAAVLGLTSPSIVVAPIALDALSDEELDQIVVHEWAHVYRRDDVARLVQRGIVALAGLHPAVWWIDRQLQLERETACDDWAVNATGRPRALAVSLTKLASLPGRPSDAVLMPAALVTSELTTRVVRLLDRSRNTSTARRLRAPLTVAPILGALALSIASVELVVTSPGGPETPREPAAPSARAAVAETNATSLAERPDAPNASGHQPRRTQAAARAPGRARQRARTTAPASESPVLFVAPAPHDDRQDAVFGAQVVEERRLKSADLPGTETPVGHILPPPAEAMAAPREQPDKGPTLWGAAADAGVTVGKGSQKAAVATAGFFTRLSKSITGVF